MQYPCDIKQSGVRLTGYQIEGGFRTSVLFLGKVHRIVPCVTSPVSENPPPPGQFWGAIGTETMASDVSHSPPPAAMVQPTRVRRPHLHYMGDVPPPLVWSHSDKGV